MLNNLERKLSKKTLVLFILTLLGLIVYSNSFTAPFTLDDFGSIVNNKSIRNLSDISAMWEFYSSRFLVYVTFSLNWTLQHKLNISIEFVNVFLKFLTGIAAFSITYLVVSSRRIRLLRRWARLLAALVPAVIVVLIPLYPDGFIRFIAEAVNQGLRESGVVGYHITNLAIHVFNSFVVFLILNKLLELDYFNEKLPGKYKNLVSAVAALVFVCHPIQVNAVTYIVQRIASLASMFYLLAVLFFIMYRTRDKLIYFLLTLLFTVAAMFSKENTITIPFMLCLIEFMFFIKDGKTSWLKRTIFLLIILSTVLIIPSTELFLDGYSQSDPNGRFKASTSMDRFVYFFTQMNVIILYIRLLFIPDKQCFDYSNDFPKSYTIWDNYSYVSFTILCLIGLLGLYKWNKNKLFSFGVLWFFIGISVESSFISIKDVYFEHRLYFPLVGFIMAVIGMIFSEKGKKNFGQTLFHAPLTFFLVTYLVMIPFYSTLTLKRNYVYSDTIRLWSDVVKKAPGSDRGHSVLAAAYMDQYDEGGCKDERIYNLAEKEFKLALKIKPKNATAHTNYSKLLFLKKDYQKSIEEANIAIKIEPSEYAYHNLGSSWKQLGDYDKALDAFRKGYNIDKERGFILRDLADLYYDYGKYTEAYIFYQQYQNYYNSSFVRKRMKQIENKNTEL